MQEFIATFIFFFAVIDPIGTVPVFISVTSPYAEQDKRKIAIRAIFISALILLFFVVAGEIILTAIEIPLPAFQVAGGIVLFLFALSMIFGESKPEEELKLVNKITETAVFPLAVPSIASPGAMLAAVLLTENSRYNFFEQVQTATSMLCVLLVALLLMLAASPIHRLIGNSGASIVSRVMGLILASVAVTNILSGIKLYFSL
ncbi:MULTISPECIES: MarC family protein [unclassified Agarivorans]|uniref:MarC family protein n=1 Tax=unclassified Agarivorans TaxID=2636026 RepID=UPI003D7E44CF